MKISNIESGKAAENVKRAEEVKILPAERPRRKVMSDPAAKAQMTPLEQGMVVAENALKEVPDIREEFVEELKERILKGEYNVSGEEIAEMMMRRRAADKIR